MLSTLTAHDVQQVDRMLKQLKDQHAEKLLMKENLRKKSEEMEIKLDRADKLVTGLAGERIRWENTVSVRKIILLVTPYMPYKYFPKCLRNYNLKKITLKLK